MAKTVQQQVDVYIVSDLRNSLFQSSTRGTDMVSIDLQRARDFGLPSYSSAVKNLLGKNITSFNDITTDATVLSNLQAIYTSIDEVDLYIGGLAEDRVTGSNLGPLYQSILIDQFQRMRDGIYKVFITMLLFLFLIFLESELCILISFKPVELMLPKKTNKKIKYIYMYIS